MECKNKSTYVSPAYQVVRVPIEELVSQKANPNQMNIKSFAALQQSIFNGGYVAPVQIAKNLEYDPSTEGQERPSLISHIDESGVANGEEGMQVADENVGRYFKWRLIDGAHRSQVVRLGKHYFEHGHDNSAKWINGEEIPSTPGMDMLAYIAWRENFTIPCVVLDMDSTMQMSMEILMNTARGAHGLEGMKDIVNNLINVAGMSAEWVAQNLFLDMESIKRMQQLSGLKASFEGQIDDADLAWTPESDGAYQRKLQAYMIREAEKFIAIYRADNADNPEALSKIPSSGSAIDMAVAIGFNPEDFMSVHAGEMSDLIK